MKVILLSGVKDLGEKDELVEVSSGYGRNYLIPNKFAAPAAPALIQAAEKRRKIRLAELEKQKEELQTLADKLSASEISLQSPAGEEGKLFGAVTSSDIAEAIKDQLGAEIDKKKINLEEPIKLAGEYRVPIHLFKEIKAEIKVKVSAQQ